MVEPQTGETHICRITELTIAPTTTPKIRSNSPKVPKTTIFTTEKDY